MKFNRCPYKEFPNGIIMKASPYHFSLEGLEDCILCRDEEDYDSFVKIIAICSRRKNVILVMYTIMSNHVHSIILSAGQEDADSFCAEVKKMISMYFNKKYGGVGILQGISAKAIYIDSDRYLRNSIAYDIRNSLDNGAKSIYDYPWTGFRCTFCEGQDYDRTKARFVASLTKRERRAIMKTDDDLRSVYWKIDSQNRLIPSTICDWRYVEEAFLHDQAYFLKTIGGVNETEMNERLVKGPKTRLNDTDMLRNINEISLRWYQKEISQLSVGQKARLMNYAFHCFLTNSSQLARLFELPLAKVESILPKKKT